MLQPAALGQNLGDPPVAGVGVRGTGWILECFQVSLKVCMGGAHISISSYLILAPLCEILAYLTLLMPAAAYFTVPKRSYDWHPQWIVWQQRSLAKPDEMKTLFIVCLKAF